MRRLAVVIVGVCLLAAASGCQQEQTTPLEPPVKPDKTPDKTPDKAPDAPTSSPIIPTTSWADSNIGTLRIASPRPDAPREPLEVKALDVDVLLIGRTSRTVVRQVFKNHTNRRTEGTYEFTLPEGAVLSRLAMNVGDKMMEGELVEREKARMIYEDIVRRQRDPALLEWQGNNRFSTQIFPIEANGEKTVIIAYEQLLPERDGQVSYRYNLPKLAKDADGSKIGEFTFDLMSEDGLGFTEANYTPEIKQKSPGASLSYSARSFLPWGPVDIGYKIPRQDDVSVTYQTAKDKTHFVADVVANIPSRRRERGADLVLVVDTSAGLGQPVVARSLAAAIKLVDAASPEAKIQVITGDYELRVCDGQDKKSALACLNGLSAGGATNLDALLTAASEQAKKMGDRVDVVLFSDGTASLGEMDSELILSKTRNGYKGVATLHTVAVGHAPNEDGLRELARATGGSSIRATPTDAPELIASRLEHAIGEELLRDVKVKILDGSVSNLVTSGATQLAPGESLAVMGQLEGKASVELSGTHEGKAWTRTIALDASGPKNELAGHFWARAHIDALEERDAPRADIVGVSLDYGVLSRYTSFLVLENEEAYKRHQIERRQETERAEEAARQGQAKVGNLKKAEGNLQDVLKGAASDKGDSKMDLAFEESEPMPSPKAIAKPRAAPARPSEMRDLEIIQQKRSVRRKKRARRRRPSSITIESGSSSGFGAGGGGSDGMIALDKNFKDEYLYKTEPEKPKVDKARLKELEGKISYLKRAERAELLELYVASKDMKKARAWYARVIEEHEDNPVDLLRRPQTREAFADEYAKAQIEHIRSGRTSAEMLEDASRYYQKKKDAEGFIETFTGRGIPEGNVALYTLQQIGHEPNIVSMVLEAMAKKQSIDVRIEFMKHVLQSSNTKPHQELHFGLLKERAEDESEGEELVELIEFGVAIESYDALPPYLKKLCNDPGERGMWCARHVILVSDKIKDKAALSELRGKVQEIYQAELSALAAKRSEDVANASIIMEQVSMLEKLGKKKEAARMMSEIVEFAPHDHSRRSLYASKLATREMVEESCAQYATAVQLNPAQRDTFRTMMGLRRAHPDKAAALRECIVSGVSKLPVKRAVSLVLTWDEPDTDVDLHIQEVGGEHVWYSDRESSNGGLLYYDITDGYGPEIYVLGSGPAGAYKLELVYYRGAPRNLKGTLTILRDVGSPEESRRDIPFTLPISNSSKNIPIGDFVLTERDRAGDGVKVNNP